MERNSIKNIIVISSGSFPYGGAAANRHISYLKGLVELGVQVNVLLISNAADQSPLSDTVEGVFSGIKFKYANWSQSKSKSFFIRGLSWAKGVYKTRRLAAKIAKENSDCAIFILSIDPLVLMIFTCFAHSRNLKIFHERTEFPFINQTSILKRLYLRIYLKQLKKIDGLFVITHALKDYFKVFVDKKKIYQIPMIVEPERFNSGKTESKYGRYIAYCGTMYSDKDGLPILIEAFDIFADEYENINLVLIGDTRKRERLIALMNVVDKARNKERIYFTGQVERDEMPSLLINADVLALARPDNIQAKGGFPTKLGEYLSTGNPVVVTRVGEIAEYLTHHNNAFLAEADNPVDFANKLKMAFNDTVKAKEIGLKGQQLVYSVFNNKVQAKILLDIFNGKS